MNRLSPSGPRTVLTALGSLRFGAVLLMLTLFTLACATVYESVHGTEQAMMVFYRARWFQALLGLVGLNVLIATALRYPFTSRQIGFVLTHVSVLVILIGAVVSKFFGVEGRVVLAEGNTTSQFATSEGMLTVKEPESGAQTEMRLERYGLRGLEPVTLAEPATLTLGETSFLVDRYLPDSERMQRVVNDAPHGHPAVRVSFGRPGEAETAWVFLDQRQRMGPVAVTFRRIEDQEQLQRLIAGTGSADANEQEEAKVRVALGGKTYDFLLQQCLHEPVKIGETEWTLRVLRYLPHAVVGKDHEIQNASPDPVNPAIEVELSGPEGSEKRLAFARFPDFGSMHNRKGAADLKVTFLFPQTTKATAPIEVIAAPENRFYARFAPRGQPAVMQEIAVGAALPTPWPGRTFTLADYYERARITQEVVARKAVRKERVPAIRLRAKRAGKEQTVWMQLGYSARMTLGGKAFELTYGQRMLPLGFAVTLEDFHIGYYPGGRRPRSFESRIAVTDPTSGRKTTYLISMNHPAKHGGFRFFQSSYRMGGDRAVSILSVSRDPGWPIVLIGYLGTIGGMLWVLRVRAREKAALEGAAGGRSRPGSKTIPLLRPGATCVSSGVPAIGGGKGEPMAVSHAGEHGRSKR